jgi:hypothetical protein
MSRRAAATLIEVLVAIFVMGIGLIALLTLFPIGIISMAQAIQDERAYQCSVNATAYANALGLRYDPWVIQDLDPTQNPFFPFGGTPPYPTGNLLGKDPSTLVDAYSNPNPFSATGTAPFLPQADSTGPSYPLFIDPIGYYTSAAWQNWVGGLSGVGVLSRRRVSFTRGGAGLFTPSPSPLPLAAPQPPPFAPGTAITAGAPIYPQGWNAAVLGGPTVPPLPQPYPYPPLPPNIGSQLLINESLLATTFTLWDDLAFDTTNLGFAATATPPLPSTGLLRNTTFSWALVCQRPTNANTSVVNLSVVVFNKRPLALGASLSLPEYIYSYNPGWPNPPLALPSPAASNATYFDPINNLITIDYTNNVPPPVRPGDWIMDVSMGWTVNQASRVAGVPPFTGTFTPHGTFYRVASVNEFLDTIAGAPRNLAQYEIQTPLRGFTVTDSLGNIIPAFPIYNSPNTLPGTTVWNQKAAPTPTATITGGGVNIGYAGSAIVFDGVVRVFDMGAGRSR